MYSIPISKASKVSTSNFGLVRLVSLKGGIVFLLYGFSSSVALWIWVWFNQGLIQTPPSPWHHCNRIPDSTLSPYPSISVQPRQRLLHGCSPTPIAHRTCRWIATLDRSSNLTRDFINFLARTRKCIHEKVIQFELWTPRCNFFALKKYYLKHFSSDCFFSFITLFGCPSYDDSGIGATCPCASGAAAHPCRLQRGPGVLRSWLMAWVARRWALMWVLTLSLLRGYDFHNDMWANWQLPWLSNEPISASNKKMLQQKWKNTIWV